MTGDGAVARARSDIDAGRLWKARDRLTMRVKHRPTDQEALTLLGEVHYRMGDLPAAGRFWILTERSGPEAEAAATAFEERWGGSVGELLRMVPIRGAVDDYPEAVRERIAALAARAEAAGIDWPRAPGSEPDWEADLEPWRLRDRLWFAGVAILGPGLWALGAGTAVYLLIRLAV